MTAQRRVNLDDLLAAIELVTDEIKVLVSAVDDLRCEIEWQARNGSTDETPIISTSPDTRNDEREERVQPTWPQPVDDSLLSATGRLRAFERACSHGPRSPWSDEWATSDDFEIPAGRLVSVGEDLWGAVLDIRPAHIVGHDCCCEAGLGAPYLLAWQSGEEFLLRELTDEEARRLQELCLACQTSAAEKGEPCFPESPAESQLGLF